MAAQHMAMDSFWVDKPRYDEAEQAYYERLGNVTLTPLADEVGRARQRLIEIRGNVEEEVAAIGVPRPPGTDGVDNKPDVQSAQKVEPIVETAAVITEEPKVVPKQIVEVKESKIAPVESKENTPSLSSVDAGALKFLEKKVQEFQTMLVRIESSISSFEARLTKLEKTQGVSPVCQKPAAASTKKEEEDDDDVDLFGSESEDDETANKVKEERLAAYNAKKSKKPALIAKSSVILDIKPWDDETDMKAMEAEVRKIEMDGLLWGASKLVPLAYGIHKLQINCVVEDEKVSIDELQEKLEAVEDYIQSVDVAAFNKI